MISGATQQFISFLTIFIVYPAAASSFFLQPPPPPTSHSSSLSIPLPQTWTKYPDQTLHTTFAFHILLLLSWPPFPRHKGMGTRRGEAVKDGTANCHGEDCSLLVKYTLRGNRGHCWVFHTRVNPSSVGRRASAHTVTLPSKFYHSDPNFTALLASKHSLPCSFSRRNPFYVVFFCALGKQKLMRVTFKAPCGKAELARLADPLVRSLYIRIRFIVDFTSGGGRLGGCQGCVCRLKLQFSDT